MKTIEITEHQRSLMQICFDIANRKFLSNAETVALPEIAEQFKQQAKESEELMMIFAEADTITAATAACDA